MQVVEGENRVFVQVDGRSIFKFDLCAATFPGDQAETGFDGQIGNCFFPLAHDLLSAGLAALDAHVAFHVADPDDLGKGLIGIMMAEDELCFLLELFAGVAVEDVLDFGQRARLVLAQHGVERQQLHIVAGLGVDLDGLAVLGVNLHFQSAAIFDPAAFRIVGAQGLAAVLRRFQLAQLVFRVGLPVESGVGMLAMLAGYLGEDLDGVGPASLINGARAVGAELASLVLGLGRHRGNERTGAAGLDHSGGGCRADQGLAGRIERQLQSNTAERQTNNCSKESSKNAGSDFESACGRSVMDRQTKLGRHTVPPSAGSWLVSGR